MGIVHGGNDSIAGCGRRAASARRSPWLVGLVGIFVALPVVLYGQFEDADHQMRDLVTRAIQDRSKLISHALAPVLLQAQASGDTSLNAQLARFASDGTVLRLMLQPPDANGFYFIASAPSIRADDVAPELDELSRRGILKKLSEACMWDASDELRYKQRDGSVELLTSIIPIKNERGCWVLTSTHTTSEFLNTSIRATPVGKRARCVSLPSSTSSWRCWPCWRRSVSGSACVASAMWPSRIAGGRIGIHAFSQRNVVPELSSVARGFDKLVLDLKRLSQQIRQSAEDNAHSFKTPLAAIQSSLSPVRRAVPAEDQRSRRAVRHHRFPPSRSPACLHW